MKNATDCTHKDWRPARICEQCGKIDDYTIEMEKLLGEGNGKMK